MSNKEIFAVDHGNKVTLVFIDVDIFKSGHLYHHSFYAGKEKTKCIDEDNGIYLVAITKRKSGFDELYCMINTTVQMLKMSTKIPLSLYNEKYLNHRIYKKYLR